MPGRPSILYPRFDHPAIEERTPAGRRRCCCARRGGELFFYDPEEPASLAAALVESEDVLVVTDPLVRPAGESRRAAVRGARCDRRGGGAAGVE